MCAYQFDHCRSAVNMVGPFEVFEGMTRSSASRAWVTAAATRSSCHYSIRYLTRGNLGEEDIILAHSLSEGIVQERHGSGSVSSQSHSLHR